MTDDAAAVDAAMAVTDEFLATFNAGDPAGQDGGELDSTLAVYKKALLLRPGDLDETAARLRL